MLRPAQPRRQALRQWSDQFFIQPAEACPGKTGEALALLACRVKITPLQPTGPTTLLTKENSAPTARTQVADAVAERIERLIIDGVLKVGQPLPSERRLCEKLGVSRSALREGLRALRGLGIIETMHGIGSFVAGLSAQRNQSPLIHLFSSQPRTLYDLLEVRALLEGEAARLAATRGTSADFVMIRRHYEDMIAAQRATVPLLPEEIARVDHAFHRAINDASHNPVLVHTLQSLSEPMLHTVLASVNNVYHRPAGKRVIDRQHERLYKAIVERQPERAERVAREHVNSMRENIMELEQEEQRLVRARMRIEGWN